MTKILCSKCEIIGDEVLLFQREDDSWIIQGTSSMLFCNNKKCKNYSFEFLHKKDSYLEFLFQYLRQTGELIKPSKKNSPPQWEVSVSQSWQNTKKVKE